MGYRLGVDIGTTYTAAAIHRDGVTEMLGLGNRAMQIPSVLYLRPEGGFLVGEPAEARAAAEPERIAREFKRRIGDAVPILVAGSPFSAEALTARLLAWVVALATERVGAPPDEITVAHPANWGGFKMDLLRQAFSLADLTNVRTVSEPEAAAITYASRQGVREDECLVVYDLGGGTFDAAVLLDRGGRFVPAGAPEGIEHLGGVDFDEAVFQHVLRALGPAGAQLDPNDPETLWALERLRRDCVVAKEALSVDIEAILPVVLGGNRSTVRLTRGEFEDLLRPALEETIGATRRVLRSAGVEPGGVTAFVLVGGSSRIPLVSELLVGAFGRPLAVDTHPKHDVALGAAMGAIPSAAHRPSGPPPVPFTPSELPPQVAPSPGPRPGPPLTPQPLPPLPGAQASPSPQQPPSGPPSEVSPPVRPPRPPSESPVRGRRGLAVAIAAVVVVVAAVIAYLVWPGSDKTPSAGPPDPTSGTSAVSSAPTTPAVERPMGAPLAPSVIAYERTIGTRTNIWRTTSDGAAPQQITHGDDDGSPVISSDRRTIFYTHRDGNNRFPRMIASDGSGDRASFPDLPSTCQNPGRAAVSHSNQVFALTCTLSPGSFSILVVTLDGTPVSAPRASGLVGDPTLSRDGKYVAFWRSLDGNTADTSIVRVNTRGVPKVTSVTDADSHDNDPMFDPAGGYSIAYRRGNDVNADIYIKKDDDKPPIRVVATPGVIEQDPCWSPDGAQIAYKRGPSDNADIWIVNADGTSPHALVDTPDQPDSVPSWGTR